MNRGTHDEDNEVLSSRSVPESEGLPEPPIQRIGICAGRMPRAERHRASFVEVEVSVGHADETALLGFLLDTVHGRRRTVGKIVSRCICTNGARCIGHEMSDAWGVL